ncbi:hypothetical protein JAK51_13795 [Stenotrophomonas maltophilia]|uniref:hypothetical protein n=1 Tax=Stenotrophomonas maltophilia TaxID=40324 RepID=UPI0021C88147|nr:hypothetical protein [Stenotrophomonas maltophilia]MCU1127290.1 hypothetical protein [Stenotrophomonas maltophilia]
MNHPTVEEFIAALGRNSESQELEIVFSKIGIQVQNLDDYRLGVSGHRIWADDAAGLQLEFKDVGLLSEMPYHNIDDGPWALTDVIFWGWRKDTGTEYAGPLPCGLNFLMSRDQVRLEVPADLGAPMVFGLSGNVDAWMLGKLELAVDYDGERGVRCVSLGLPQEE